MNRYTVEGPEGEYEPGSNEKVLSNLLGITTSEDMADAETSLLFKLYEVVFARDMSKLTNLTLIDIKHWHRQWLGNIYPWAGQYRSVNMGKGDFEFATASNIEFLADQFEKCFLSQFANLPGMSLPKQISFLAQSHVEFILIHPFREGNGRLSRLLMDVMAVKAGFAPLDYSLWDQNKEFYFKSIQAGHNKDYQHIERLVADVLALQNVE